MRAVVTGGGGFVGKALCAALRKRGFSVLSLARGRYPELQSLGVETAQIDISTELHRLTHQCSGTDAVFHVASKVDMWGPYEDFYRTNVLGTQNVIAACRAAAVPKLIYTSSPSVVSHDEDLQGADESVPYPTRYMAYYPETKAIAERAVLAANGVGLATVALRPHLIWGPGDTNLIPTILERARAGRLVRVGDGTNLVDVTYIADCVEAHLAALDALDRSPVCRGKAYFISQGEPVNMWSWIDQILDRSGIPRVSRAVPVPLARALAYLCEIACRGAPFLGEPLLTRFLVSQMSRSHYYNINAARQELGFSPRYTVADGMDQTFPKFEGGTRSPLH